jgi:hypothetical protein
VHTNTPTVAVPTDETPRRSRVATRLIWAVVAVMAVVVTLINVVTNTTPAGEPAYPSNHLDNPIAPWGFELVQPVMWVIALIFIIIQTMRKRTFSVPALFFLSATTMFWIEWPADWGSYLVWNRDFLLFEGWTSTWFQTYWKPVCVVFGYGVFFGGAGIMLIYVIPAIKRALPKVPPTLTVVASSAILFYTFDILLERVYTWLGWYSYVEPPGPLWTSDHGTLSLTWPAIPFVFFAVGLTLLMDRVDDSGFFPHERLFRINRMAAGWDREFARFGVWILTMNVVIFVSQPLALVVGRELFLWDSVYVP